MEHNMAYMLGVFAGLAIGLLAVAAIQWIAKKAGGKFGVFCKCKEKAYDERQLLARGQAYKAGFFTLMIYIVIVVFLDEIFDIHFLMSFGGMWLGVCISISVFAIVCILKDAYMSLQENAKGILMVFGGIEVMNICFSLPNLLHGEGLTEVVQGVKNGEIYEYTKLSVTSMNLTVGILFAVILAAFLGKMWYDRKHENEDE